jgi:hypothetical protein
MSTLAPARLSFGELLDYHFKRGTRPGGNTDHPGRMWTTQAFAHAVGYGDRAVRHWLNDRHLPMDIETIERVLFGPDYTHYWVWRLVLREAYRVGLRSRGRRGRGRASLKSVTTSDIVLPNNSGNESEATSTACVLETSTQ